MGVARQPPMQAMSKENTQLVLWLIEQVKDINDRIDKLLGAAGYFAKFDENGNITDSGKLPPSGEVVGDTDPQTLTQKTLTTPTVDQPTINQGTLEQPIINQGTFDAPSIADMTEANHNHEGVVGGGVLGVAALGTSFLDENDMVSDSDTAVASQQSIKAYVDAIAPAGFTGSFTTGDATTATVVDGLITGVA